MQICLFTYLLIALESVDVRGHFRKTKWAATS